MSKQRLRPGERVIKDMRRLQATTNRLMTRTPFDRLCRSIAQNYKNDVRFQADAIDGLQEYAEMQMIRMMRNAKAVAEHSDRVTVQGRDLAFAEKIRNKHKKGRLPMKRRAAVDWWGQARGGGGEYDSELFK